MCNNFNSILNFLRFNFNFMRTQNIKIVFSFLMVLSLLTPTITPFVAEDWYKMVVKASNEEENTTEHQKNGEAKLIGENDLFVYGDFLQVSVNDAAQISNYYYLGNQTLLTFEIILPPPEIV